ncbi:retrovirus-related pol polyprotein from transposon TNT 1-94 [Tanacetum coccineum]
MTGVKQYLHRYLEESGPKVVFRDSSSGDTEGYGSVNYNGITFTRVAYVNGLKHNLISISQLCDADFKFLFTKCRDKIANGHKEGLKKYTQKVEKPSGKLVTPSGSTNPLYAKHQRVVKGLAEYKASASNIKCIQVKDIVKEVEDYLKTYSSAGMDISGSSHVTNVPAFDKDDFTSWKVRFLVFLDGLEPYLLTTLEDGPFQPMLSLSTPEHPLPKHHNQWSNADSRLANQDKRLKSIIISCLPNDVMKLVIKCKTTKEMWNDLILTHEGPSDIRDTKIAALRLKFNAFKALEGEKVNGTFTRLKSMLNDLENNGIVIPQAEDNDLDVEEDQRTNNEFMANLNAEYHERALLANQKSNYKRSGRVGSAKKPIDKSNETCFTCRKLGHFQKDCLSNKISTPSYLSPHKSFNKPKLYTPSFTQTSSQNTGNHQKDYKGKNKALKAEIAALTKRIDDLIKGKSKKGKGDKGKSDKGLIAESFDWHDESVSSEDEGTTKIKAFMEIAEDEPSVGKADARSFKTWENDILYKDEVSDLKKEEEVGEKRITPQRKLFSQRLMNHHLSQLLRSPLTLKLIVTHGTLCPSAKFIGRNALTDSKSTAIQISYLDKKANSSTEQLLLTLMEEAWYGPCKHYGLKNHLFDDFYSKPKCSTCGSDDHLTKEHTEQTAIKETLKKLQEHSPLKSTPKKNPRMTKPFNDCKYCGSNNHHSDECEFYPGCEICRSIAHEIVDCPKNLRNSKKPRIANKQSNEPTEKYSEESGPKVVFGDNSSGYIKGYGSVNCNGITFTRVAYVNGTILNQNDEVVLIALRRRDVYVFRMSSYNKESNTCFYAKASPSVNWLWQKRLSHLNFKTINNLAKHNLVSGLPSLTFSKDKNCLACEKGKHHRATFKTKRSFSINKCLHLLHMDLFGPVKLQTISHNKYALMENLNETRVKQLRSDNGTEFKNHTLEEFCDEKGISPNFSSPCTPKQNGVAERRNRTLIEAIRTMLNSASLPKQFWGKAVNVACYTQNRSIIVKRHRKTAYEVFRGRAPNIGYFHVFGCHVHIHDEVVKLTSVLHP